MATTTSDLIKHFELISPLERKVLNEYKKSLSENIFFLNIDLLSQESDLIKFDRDDWMYRPDVFCNDHYDEPYIFPVILTINNIPTFFQFIPENFVNEIIIAPRLSAIYKVLENV